MPILKPISGHGSTGGIRRYLEKGGRALARDFFNLSWDERKDIGAPEELKAATEHSVRGFRAVLFGEKAFRTDLVVFIVCSIFGLGFIIFFG